ncbi:hypothetical protein ACFL59_16380 [Planctomycetota bacterium]
MLLAGGALIVVRGRSRS